MRIALVSLDGHLPRYGIGLAVARLARALSDAGHDVTLLVRDANAAGWDPGPRVRVVGLAHVGGLFGGRFAYARQIRRALADGVDAVHAHDLSRAAHWLLSPRVRRGAPLVVTAHASDELGASASPSGSAPPRRARRHARHVTEVLARAHAVIAPSRWMAGLVTARVRRERGVVVVPHGPTDEVAVERASHDGFRVLAMARFVEVKGLAVLLEAFARALGGDPAARLTLAGDGPLRPVLEERAAALGLSGRVEFPGYADGEVRRRLLARADLVAVPTLRDYETFGLAALDASAAGVPVLVADGGALPERVEGGGGMVVRSGDVSAWAAGLLALRGDPVRRLAQGSAGKEASAGLTWERAAQAHLGVYEGAREGDSTAERKVLPTGGRGP